MKKVQFIIVLVSFFVFRSAGQPVISSVNPSQGPAGITITIAGNNFNPVADENIVYFGVSRAKVITATAGLLTVTVPSGATYQPISVTANNLTAYSSKPFVVTFAGGTPVYNNRDDTQYFFDPQVDFTTDLHPNGIAIADFDGDNKPDIATPNNYSTTGSPASVSVLRNTGIPGAVSFAARTDLITGVLTYAIAAADLDGDGKPDLISSSVEDQTISVFRNTSTSGSIAFASRIDFPAGSFLSAIAVADIDKDGKPDIIITNQLANSFSVYRNTSKPGAISLAQKADFLTALAPQSLAAGDLDNDGRTDVAVVNEFSNSVSVFRNISSPGSILFAPKTDFATGSNPFGVAIGDINSDALPDLVIANYGAGTISILRNTGSGSISFAAKLDLVCGSTPTGVTLGDVTGDGKVDLVIPGSKLCVYSNAGGSSILMNGLVYLPTLSDPFIVGLADFDGDGKNDISGAAFTSDRVFMLRNKNGEPTIVSFTPVTAEKGKTVTITGINFSGATAVSFGGVPAASFSVQTSGSIVAVVDTGASGDVSVTTKYGTHKLPGFTFASPPVITSYSPAAAGRGITVTITGKSLTGTKTVSFGGTSCASFTVVNDRTITAVVAEGATGDVVVTTLYGTAASPGFTFIPAPVISSFTPMSGGTGTIVTITGENFTAATAVSLGGVPAAAYTVLSANTVRATVAEGGSGSITVTTTGGAATGGAFVFPKPVISSLYPASGYAGTPVTITGDNFRNGADNNTVYFGGVKAPILSASTKSITVSAPPATTYAPVMVVTNQNLATARQPFGMGFPGASPVSPGSFKWIAAFRAPGTPGTIRIADLDADGKLDIITTNETSGSLNILRNITSTGVISYAPAITIANPPVYFHVRDIAVGDLNGDGLQDIAYDDGFSTVYIFKNTSTKSGISFAPAVLLHVAEVYAFNIQIADFDGDGRADIAVSNGYYYGSESNDAEVSVLRNTGTDEKLSFAPIVNFRVPVDMYALAASDVDGDGKPDFVVSSDNGFAVYLNTGKTGALSFTKSYTATAPLRVQSLLIADMDGDDRKDIVITNYSTSTGCSIFRNTGTTGSPAFDPPINISTDFEAEFATIGNLDGDTLPDLVITSNKVTWVYSNSSLAGKISFRPKVNFYTQVDYNWATSAEIGDLDADGRQDLIVANSADVRISVFRNQTGETSVTLCAGDSTLLASVQAGSTYQWQVNTGNGFINISNNGNYNGTTAATLRLNNMPAYSNGYQYRCLADGTSSGTYVLAIPQLPKPVAYASAPTSICSGSSVVLTSTQTTGNQWYLNDSLISSAISPDYQATKGGTYTVRTNVDGCHSASSDAVPVTVIPSVTPTVSISFIGCGSGVLSFNATIGNASANDLLQWYVNNTLVASTPTYRLYNPADGTQVYARLTSTIVCAIPQVVNSPVTTVNCAVTAIPDINGLEFFQVGPNPSNGLVEIQLKLNLGKKLSFEVFNNAGIKVYTADAGLVNGTVKKSIDLRGEVPGMYYLKTMIGNKPFTQKIQLYR